MSTTETEQDTLIRPATTKFVSRSPNFRIWRIQPTEEYIRGEKKTTAPGLVYEFHESELVVSPGQDPLPTGPGEQLEDAAEWLERQDSFGYWYTRADRAAPDPAGVFLEVNRLGLLGEVDRLKEMLAMERANWQREPVITAIEQSLETLEGPPPAA